MSAQSENKKHSIEKQLSLFHFNVRSLENKTERMNLFLENKDFDILCFSEHWYNEDEVKLASILEYKVISSYCRPANKHGDSHGGVLICSKSNIKFKKYELINQFCIEKHFELTAVKLSQFNVLVIAVYRCPSGDFKLFYENFNDMLQLLNTKNEKVLILGDFR